MLGTGDATARKRYNTCFILRDRATAMLVDGGGGNGILAQLNAAGISFRNIDAIFLTHAHTDHILGVVWVLRMIGEMALDGEEMRGYRVFSHDEGIRALVIICRATLSEKVWAEVSRLVEFVEIRDGDNFELSDAFALRCIDLRAGGMKQFGFVATVGSGVRVACMGDVPAPDGIEREIAGCDWLLHEAFCPESQRAIYHPELICHCTALEAGRIARHLNVRHLLLYHRADYSHGASKDDYIRECESVFSGRVVIPEDLQAITVD